MTIGSDRIFETLFHSSNEGIVIVGDSGKIIKANPAIHHMFGYKQSLENQSIDQLLPEKLRKTHRRHRGEFKKEPKARAMGQDIELFGQRQDGSIFPVEVSLSPSEVDGNKVVIAFVIDITERKKREQVEFSMGRMFDQSLNEIYIFSSESLKFIRVNRAATDNLRYSMDELEEMTPLCLKKDFTPDKFEEMIGPLRQGTPMIKFESRHWRKDGTTYPVEVHLQLTTFDMKPAFMSIILDISERKMAENRLREYSFHLEKRVKERTRELRESQKLHDAIARNFPDGMISVFDKNLQYVYVEGKELYALGITSEMLIGTSYLDRLAPEVAKRAEKELREVFDGQATSIDIKFKNNYYVLEAVPITDDNGSISHILVIEKNITERKKTEEKVRRALEHERELSELKSRFVSTASHEFRTPLSTILSSVSLLTKYKSMEDQEKWEKHIQRIRGSVHNLTGILNDFLSLDKLETGAVEGNPVAFNLPEFVQETCDQVSPTLKKSQTISYRHQGPEEVMLDKQILNNILLNLLSNASKYSNIDGIIEVSTGIKDEQVNIEIKDQGIGISKEDQKHLFERFFRSKNAINIPGTGLGLNIVKKYVNLLNGTIEVESSLGHGSTFTVIIKKEKT